MPRNEKQRLYSQWAQRTQKFYREIENSGKHSLPKYATRYIKKEETKSETDNHSEPGSVNPNHPADAGNAEGGIHRGSERDGNMGET